MSEPNYTSREIAEIREWLVRLDTKLDMLNDVKKTADSAEHKAERALQKIDDQARQIEGIKKTAMWAIGIFATIIATLSAAVITVAF
jgi:hypothetical protein